MKLVLPIVTALLAVTAHTQTSPTTRFRAAEKVWMDHQGDGAPFHDDSPEAIAAMNSMRRTAIEVVTQLLAKRPDSTAAQLQRILTTLTGNTAVVGSEALQLQPGVFAIAFNDFPSSILFIVRTRPRSSPLVCSITSPGPQPIDTGHRLNGWLATRSGNRCQENMRIHYLLDTCGPLSASIGLLPSDVQGNPRFYLDADYSKEAGILIGKQTSIWRWNQDHAELLWLGYYAYNPDQDSGVHFRNGELRIDQKDSFHTFFANNSDSPRHMLQRVRVTPTGVEDLGVRSLDPELDLVDNLFDRIARGQPADRLASPEVIRQLRPDVRRAKDAKDKTAYFGMIEDWSLHRHPVNTALCLSFDDSGPYYFTLHHEPNGAMRVTSVSHHDEGPTAQPPNTISPPSAPCTTSAKIIANPSSK
jgi:hypothetical protein